MFSDTRQLRVLQHNNVGRHCRHHCEPMVQDESGNTCRQTGADPNPLPRRETELDKDVRKAQRKERWGNNGLQNLQQILVSTQLQPCGQAECFGQSCPGELDTTRWDPSAAPDRRPGASVRNYLRECAGMYGNSYLTEQSALGMDYAPRPRGFTGQQSYRPSDHVAEKPLWSGTTDTGHGRPHVHVKGHSVTNSKPWDLNSTNDWEYRRRRPNPVHLTSPKYPPGKDLNRANCFRGGIFWKEAHQKGWGGPKKQGQCPSGGMAPLQSELPSESNGQKKEPGPDRTIRSRVSVQDQIRRVVLDLEGVLGGLREVQLEMKEVIERIDFLTSSLDLTEEEL